MANKKNNCEHIFVKIAFEPDKDYQGHHGEWIIYCPMCGLDNIGLVKCYIESKLIDELNESISKGIEIEESLNGNLGILDKKYLVDRMWNIINSILNKVNISKEYLIKLFEEGIRYLNQFTDDKKMEIINSELENHLLKSLITLTLNSTDISKKQLIQIIQILQQIPYEHQKPRGRRISLTRISGT